MIDEKLIKDEIAILQNNGREFRSEAKSLNAQAQKINEQMKTLELNDIANSNQIMVLERILTKHKDAQRKKEEAEATVEAIDREIEQDR
jgi:hypothetical protein